MFFDKDNYKEKIYKFKYIKFNCLSKYRVKRQSTEWGKTLSHM